MYLLRTIMHGKNQVIELYCITLYKPMCLLSLQLDMLQHRQLGSVGVIVLTHPFPKYDINLAKAGI